MKAMRIFFVALCFVFVPFMAAFGQITTNGTGGGVWSSASTWTGGVVPDGSGTIIIAATDSIIYTTAVNISGTLTKNSARKDSMEAGGSITFANGSNYIHAVNGGTIPIATWQTGSTCAITGATNAAPGNNAQAFANFTWDCAGQTTNLNLSWGVNAATIINGNLTVKKCGISAGFQFRMSPTAVANSITINGDVVVSPDPTYYAYLAPSGSATSAEMFVNVLGNVSISGGTSTIWAVSNNSSGVWTWNLYGNLSIASSCSLRVSGTGKIVFAKNGLQTASVPTDVVKNGTALLTAVSSGSTLDMGTSYFHVNAFTVSAGATLISASPTGLDGNIRTLAATLTFAPTSSYIFNGSAAQVTGTIMPATVKNVTINNTADVTSSQSLTITDTLFLLSGALLGPYTAGTTTDVEEINALGLPDKFVVKQNYPNPFNPSTTIVYGISKSAFVTVKVYNLLGQEVALLFSGQQAAGTYPVTFKADHLSSGVYLYRVQADNSFEVKRMLLVK